MVGRIVTPMKSKPLTCIDLFAGCGGFSLGLHRAGLNILAAIDFDPVRHSDGVCHSFRQEI